MFIWRFEGRKAVLLAIGKRRAPRAAVEESVVRNILLTRAVMAGLAAFSSSSSQIGIQELRQNVLESSNASKRVRSFR